jgi:hypothetical protein
MVAPKAPSRILRIHQVEQLNIFWPPLLVPNYNQQGMAFARAKKAVRLAKANHYER